jgi:TetR/AcrR family fatty acid metabolism transcriptional regulator
MPTRQLPETPRNSGARPAAKAGPVPAAESGRSRRGAVRRREILGAAYEVFSAKGYDDASVAEIAAIAGIVEGGIYKHFANKRELLFETMREFYAGVVGEAREQLAGIQGTRNRLRFAIWRHLRAFSEAPGICRLIIQDIRPKRDYQQSVVYELNRETTSVVFSIIEEAVARGELRADVPAAMVRDVIFGGIEHVMWKALEGDSGLDIDRLADQLCDFVLRGVASDAFRCDLPGNEDCPKNDREDNDIGTSVTARLGRIEAKLDTLQHQNSKQATKESI